MDRMLGGLGTTHGARPPDSSAVRAELGTRDARDAWELIEAATITALGHGLAAPETRARLDRMLAAFEPAGATARVRTQGTCEEGDAIAAALFEGGAREIRIEAAVEIAELDALVAAIVRCVRHSLRAPFEPRRPTLSLAHVELRTARVGETGNFLLREQRTETARPIESAALTAIAQAPAGVASGARRSAEAETLARLSRESWDARFATLAVDAAITRVGELTRAGATVSATAALGRRPRARSGQRARVLAALTSRRLESGLAEAVRAYLESALAGAEVAR